MVSDQNQKRRTVGRRDVLTTLGAAGATLGLAGCTSSQDGTGGGDGNSDGGNGNSDGGDGNSDGGDGNSGGDNDGSTSGGGGEKTIRLGQPIPLTGPVAGYGTPVRASYQMLIDAINSNGGLNADGTTVKLEYLPADTQGDPQTGRNAAEKLLSKNVDVMLTGTVAGVTLGWVDKVIEEEVFLLNDVMQSVEMATLDYDYYIGSAPGNANPRYPNLTANYPLGKYAVNELGYERIAFLTSQDLNSRERQKWVSKSVKEAGGTVAGNVTHPIPETEFSDQIEKLKSMDADAIVSGAIPSASFAFLEQAKSAGLLSPANPESGGKPEFITMNLLSERSASALTTPDVADGFYDHGYAPKPAIRAVENGNTFEPGPVDRLETYRSDFNEQNPNEVFSVLTMWAKDALVLLKNCIEKGGGIDNGSLVEGRKALTWSDIQDEVVRYYTPPEGSVEGTGAETTREGKIFDSQGTAYTENTIALWDKGKKNFHDVVRVGPYWE